MGCCSPRDHAKLAKKTGKGGVYELTTIVASEKRTESEDGSASVGSLIAYETMLHDETRGIIQEGDKANCANASSCLVWNPHLMEIGVPQVIHAPRDESRM
jgi:hypothetical protein